MRNLLEVINMAIALLLFLVAAVSYFDGRDWQFSAFICLFNLILATSHSA
jgi:hypothetical protein